MGFFKVFDDANIEEEKPGEIISHLIPNDNQLTYSINKLISPNKVLLIDDPKTISMLESIKIVIDALPDGHELKSDNPLNEIKGLLNQFSIKSGDYENRSIVGGYQEISGNGKRLNNLEIAKNKFGHRENVIKQFPLAEKSIVLSVDRVMKNWDALVATSDIAVSKKYLPEDKKLNIADTFSDKEKTRKNLTSLYMDIRDKKDLYAKRFGIEGEVSASMGRG